LREPKLQRRFDFERSDYTDFLLSPVAAPDAVVGNLEVLWELRENFLDKR
jgi:hypothetical protein